MERDDLILISVDDHIIEPPGMFEGHLPEKYEDDAPKLVHRDDGTDVWQFRQYTMPNIGLNAVAGRPKEEYGIEPHGVRRDPPRLFRRTRAHQGHERGRRPGLDVLPVVPRLQPHGSSPTEDHEFALALVRAYNDWHIDEWCGAYPGRFIPMALPPSGTPRHARRGAPRGEEGLPLAHLHREPGAPRATRASTIVTGTRCGGHCATRPASSRAPGLVGAARVTAPDAPVDVMITLQPMNICRLRRTCCGHG